MQFEHVTCPHCGILCDDLTVEVSGSTVTPLNIGHPNCTRAFEQASNSNTNTTSAVINGNDATIQTAIDKAGEILINSNQPLISGLIADVQACREALALAEKLGGVIDHANGAHMRANVAVMQRIGIVKTTLAEVRNRADNVILFGADILERFPRLMERILAPNKSLGADKTINKNITIIDSQAEPKAEHLDQANINYLRLDAPDLESIIQMFALIVEETVELDDNDQVVNGLKSIHKTILTSDYSTIIWNSSLFDHAAAEHTVQTITQIIKSLMTDVRCVGLPLGGSKAEITASHVATWQTGVPLPVAYMNGTPIHDPLLYRGVTMLENKEADSLVWISTYSSSDVPPETDIPTIVIGHPAMQTTNNVDVFIPVGIPGIDTRGLACRADSVATLPLQKLRENKLLAASDVLNKLVNK